MSTNLNGRQSSAIKNKGGNRWALRRVNADGSASGTETWFDGGYREKFDFAFERGLEEFKDEAGEIVAVEDGDVKAEIKITAMQSDATTFNFLANETQNQYYAINVFCGESINNTSLFLYAPVVRIQNKVNVAFPGRKPEITISPLSPPISWNGNSLTAGSVTAWEVTPASLSASLTGNAGVYFRFQEK